MPASTRILLARGSRVGPYELLDQIDEDDLASVWLGRDSRSDGAGAPVRVQVLDQRVSSQLELRSEFLTEARAMAGVRHRKLLRVLDVGTDEPHVYVTFEHVDAAPLDEMLGEARRRAIGLGPATIVQLGLDVLAALDAVHSAERVGRELAVLIHGDLTPRSVLVTEEGVARLVPTCLGAVVCSLAPGGSPDRLSYKSPEQLQRAARGTAVDGRSDLFALGVLLWGVFAGHRLFVAEDGAHLVRSILSGSIPKLGDIALGVSKEVASVVDRALARDPAERFDDASEMHAALEAAAHSELAHAVRTLVGDRLATRRARLLELFGYGPPSPPDPTEEPPAQAPSPAGHGDLAGSVGIRALAPPLSDSPPEPSPSELPAGEGRPEPEPAEPVSSPEPGEPVSSPEPPAEETRREPEPPAEAEGDAGGEPSAASSDRREESRISLIPDAVATELDSLEEDDIVESAGQPEAPEERSGSADDSESAVEADAGGDRRSDSGDVPEPSPDSGITPEDAAGKHAVADSAPANVGLWVALIVLGLLVGVWLALCGSPEPGEDAPASSDRPPRSQPRPALPARPPAAPERLTAAAPRFSAAPPRPTGAAAPRKAAPRRAPRRPAKRAKPKPDDEVLGGI